MVNFFTNLKLVFVSFWNTFKSLPKIAKIATLLMIIVLFGSSIGLINSFLEARHDRIFAEERAKEEKEREKLKTLAELQEQELQRSKEYSEQLRQELSSKDLELLSIKKRLEEIDKEKTKLEKQYETDKRALASIHSDIELQRWLRTKLTALGIYK